MKKFTKPTIEVIEVDDYQIILCSAPQEEHYGPDVPVVDPDIW